MTSGGGNSGALIYSWPVTGFGAVAPFPAAPTGTVTSLSACTGATHISGKNQLTQNVGATGNGSNDPQAECFQMSNGTTLDLNGFTITGWIADSSSGTGVTRVYSSQPGGTIDCDSPDQQTGTINTSGTAVTRVSGIFQTGAGVWTNRDITITIGGTPTLFVISSVTDANDLVLTTSAGTNSAVAYTVGQVGCINIQSGFVPTSGETAWPRIDHITINNAADPGTQNVTAAEISESGGAETGGNVDLGMQMDHISGTLNSAPNSSRSIFLYPQDGKNRMDVSYNDITVSGSACSGNPLQALLANNTGIAVNSTFEYNRINAIQNTTFPANINCDTVRPIDVDDGDTANITDSSGATVLGNIVNVNNNRCIRVRGVVNVTLEDNLCLNVTGNTDGAGAMHFGDTSNYQSPSQYNLLSTNNLFTLVPGSSGIRVYFTRSVAGIKASSDMIWGTAGAMAYVDSTQPGTRCQIATASASSDIATITFSGSGEAGGCGITTSDTFDITGATGFNITGATPLTVASDWSSLTFSCPGCSGTASTGKVIRYSQMTFSNIFGGLSLITNSTVNPQGIANNCQAANTTWSGTGTLNNLSSPCP